MKSVLLTILCLVSTFAYSMPIGLRTAVWGGSAAERLAAVDAAFPTLDDDATAEDVATALSEVADTALAENITDVGEYIEFREWAKYANAADVKDSLTAWLSFAIGSAGLVSELQENDISIDTVNMAADGKLEVVFSLDGINVDADALEYRLKTVLGVEGAPTLDEKAFSNNDGGLSLVPNGDGRIRAVVIPPADINAYFMRIKVK